ncbi:hypothetical protein FTO74_18725 [Granulicella sp. WH15]|uniref:DUF6624 domain-containing protein n=1 Tax=Granulicella sp. WH15 TaxID=2602070 RepID=UPI001366FA2A|nr:DUF6624 domain-containing protein [Granulicella sp. WH15]QHN05156.1 hypothetical protein FTO74_18725 [Granulicella sp. WH15]
MSLLFAKSSAALLSLVLASPVVMSAQAAQPAWKQELQQRHDALVQQNGPGTDTALRDQLMGMRNQDRVARGLQQAPGTKPAIATNLAEIDASLTEQLKGIVKAKGWPTIALVGIEASNGAMLILTHTADHEWQRSLLPTLVNLADAGKIDGSTLALVVDKELIAEGKLQRYGSQFKLVDGAMAMYAVEDPGGLDRRRAQVLLPPMDAYKQQMASIYHLKVSNQIVMASPSVR